MPLESTWERTPQIGVAVSIGVKDEGCGVWRKVEIRQDRRTGEGRLDVVEGSIALLGPLKMVL